MAGDRPVLLGLLLYLLVAVAPTLVLWLTLRLLPAAVGVWCEWCRGRSLPPEPSLEPVVGDLRRLRREVLDRPQSTQVRRLALIAAYDQTLQEVCGLAGVDTALPAATGRDRSYARLLTEAALEDAGIALDPPADGRRCRGPTRGQ
jgi:hypothetical protein